MNKQRKVNKQLTYMNNDNNGEMKKTKSVFHCDDT